jgi:hypothetical protein
MATTQQELDDIGVELGMLEHTLSTLVSAAKLDGTIDDEEQESIDDMEQCIRAAKRKRDELQAELAGSTANGAAQSSKGSSAGAAAAPFNYTLARIVPGGGGYVYAQWSDGEIVIMQGPGGKKDVPVKRGTAAWEAITKEIGTYGGNGSTSSSAPSAAASNSQGPLAQPLENGAAGTASGQCDSSLVAAIAEKQIALQMELLNASPDEAKAIIAELEAANLEMEQQTARLAGKSGNSSAPTEPLAETETLGESLLVLHADLYQEFLNAGDPLNPDMLTAGQEQILEAMRDISEELAIEAERSVMAQENPRLEGLEGEEFEDEYQLGLYEDSEGFNNEGATDSGIDTGESDPSGPSNYFSMFSEGESGKDKTVDEILADLEMNHDKMLSAQALGPEYVNKRKQQIIELYKEYDAYGDVTNSINEVISDGKLIGFRFSVPEGVVLDDNVPNEDRGLPHTFLVDLNGKVLKAIESNDMFTTVPGAAIDAAVKEIAEASGAPEIAVAVPLEIAVATLGAPVEAVLDAADLMDATAKWVKDEDGSIFPLLVLAAVVVIPYSRAGKRVFRVKNELGEEVIIEAGELVASLDKRSGTLRPDGVGFMTDSQMDEAAAFARADPGTSDAARRRFEDLKQRNRARYDEIREEYKRKYGKYPEFDRDPVPQDIADDIDQAFDEMVDDTPLPDDWYKSFDPDVEKVYKDNLPQVDFDWDNLHDDVYEILGEKLGIKGGAAEIKLRLKNLYKLISRDFPTQFRPLWDEAVEACPAAREKIAELPDHIDAIKSAQRKYKGLDPNSEEAKKLSKKIDAMTVTRNKLARDAFDLVRNAFWTRANKRLEKYMTDAGLNVGKGKKAAALDGVDQPISIEHGIGLEEKPLRAIDGSHMMFSPNYENTQILRMRRNLIKQRFEELGYKGPHPWL